MIALLAVNMLVIVSECLADILREQLVCYLDLLQTKNIGFVLAQEALDRVAAEADRIDVPGADTHQFSIVFSSLLAKRQINLPLGQTALWRIKTKYLLHILELDPCTSRKHQPPGDLSRTPSGY